MRESLGNDFTRTALAVILCVGYWLAARSSACDDCCFATYSEASLWTAGGGPDSVAQCYGDEQTWTPHMRAPFQEVDMCATVSYRRGPNDLIRVECMRHQDELNGTIQPLSQPAKDAYLMRMFKVGERDDGNLLHMSMWAPRTTDSAAIATAHDEPSHGYSIEDCLFSADDRGRHMAIPTLGGNYCYLSSATSRQVTVPPPPNSSAPVTSITVWDYEETKRLCYAGAPERAYMALCYQADCRFTASDPMSPSDYVGSCANHTDASTVYVQQWHTTFLKNSPMLPRCGVEDDSPLCLDHYACVATYRLAASPGAFVCASRFERAVAAQGTHFTTGHLDRCLRQLAARGAATPGEWRYAHALELPAPGGSGGTETLLCCLVTVSWAECVRRAYQLYVLEGPPPRRTADIGAGGNGTTRRCGRLHTCPFHEPCIMWSKPAGEGEKAAHGIGDQFDTGCVADYAKAHPDAPITCPNVVPDLRMPPWRQSASVDLLLRSSDGSDMRLMQVYCCAYADCLDEAADDWGPAAYVRHVAFCPHYEANVTEPTKWPRVTLRVAETNQWYLVDTVSANRSVFAFRRCPTPDDQCTQSMLLHEVAGRGGRGEGAKGRRRRSRPAGVTVAVGCHSQLLHRYRATRGLLAPPCRRQYSNTTMPLDAVHMAGKKLKDYARSWHDTVKAMVDCHHKKAQYATSRAATRCDTLTAAAVLLALYATTAA